MQEMLASVKEWVFENLGPEAAEMTRSITIVLASGRTIKLPLIFTPLPKSSSRPGEPV